MELRSNKVSTKLFSFVFFSFVVVVLLPGGGLVVELTQVGKWKWGSQLTCSSLTLLKSSNKG